MHAFAITQGLAEVLAAFIIYMHFSHKAVSQLILLNTAYINAKVAVRKISKYKSSSHSSSQAIIIYFHTCMSNFILLKPYAMQDND